MDGTENRAGTHAAGAGKKARRWRRLLKGAGIALACLAALAIALVALLLLPPVRGAILGYALSRAAGYLPGELAVEKARWPGLETIEIGGVLWEAEGRTVLSADTVAVDIRLVSLMRRDIEARTVVAHGVIADIPGIMALFPPDTTGGRSREEDEGQGGFPRPGAVPGLPSLAVDSLSVTAPSIKLAEGNSITGLALAGGFDLSEGGSGALRIRELRLAGEEAGYAVNSLSLHANLREGKLEGSGEGRVAEGLPIVFAAASTGQDALRITLAMESGLAPPEDPGIAAALEFERDEGSVRAIGFDVALKMPDADEIAAWNATPSQASSFLAVQGASAEASGRVELPPGMALQARCVLRQPQRLERGMAALRYRDRSAVIDSLAVTLPQGVTLRTAGNAELEETITARLEPVVLESGADSASGWAPSGEMPGRIVYSRNTGGLSVEGLEVAGDFGDMRISGRLDGDRRGGFDLAAVWTEPPAAFYGLLAEEPGLADSLRPAWSADAPYRMDASVRLHGGDRAGEIEADASLRLPGPRNLRPLLPDSPDVAGMGPLAGSLDFRYMPGDILAGVPVEIDFLMSLAETDWIDSGDVHVSMNGDSLYIDRFLLAAGELRLDMEGAYDRGAGKGAATAGVTDEGFLRHFSPSIPDMDLYLEASFAGLSDSLESREVHASLHGEVAGAAYAVPSLAGTLAVEGEAVRAQLLLAEGVASDRARLDMLLAEFASTGEGVYPADIALEAKGGKYRFRQRMTLEAGDTLVFRVDSLVVSAQEKDLRAARPFTVTVERGTGAFAVDGMDLAGSLGYVRADGYAGPEGVRLEGSAAIDFPEYPPPGLEVPYGGWPARLEASLDVPSSNDLSLDARLEGFTLDDGREAQVRFVLAGTDTGVSSTIALDSGSIRLVEGTLRLPAAVTAYPPSLVYHGGDVDVGIALDDYPLLVRGTRGGLQADDLIALIDADIVVAGPPRAPAAFAGAEMRFPDWPDLSDFSFSVECAVRPDSLRDSGLRQRAAELSGRVSSDLGIDSVRNLVASFAMRRGQVNGLEGSITYPVNLGLDPFDFSRGEGDMAASLLAEKLPLEDIDVFLPEDVGLGGTMEIELTAKGQAGDPGVSGTLGMRDLDVRYRQLVSLLMQGDLSLEGTASRPVVKGNLAIGSGSVNLPTNVKELHPVEGDAILLDTDWRPQADYAALAGAPSDSAAEALDDIPPFEADYDVSLDIARGFWLRGEGLEIQLDGTLDIQQKNGMPVIAGDLNARSGSFLFLGRLFTLERGTISFYGEEELNPALDLTVTSVIESYRIVVRLGGTLERPELDLTSEPDLPEGDIVAIIVFGQPLDSLDDGQGNMLMDRTAEIAIAMGAAKLQQSLAGQGGVDIVSVRSARGESGEGSALVVGKYITPELLLSYEQALKEKSTSYIVLEYMLTRYIKLETLYSNQSRTGVGLSVEKDY